MAAVNLSTKQTFPCTRVIATVGTTWQEVILPSDPACRRVSVYLSAAGKVSFTGDDDASDPADGSASGSTTNKQTVAATTWTAWNLGPTNARRPTSIFVAAAAGTIDVELSLEG